MRAANISTSPRLQRVLSVLQSGKAYISTRGIIRKAKVCAVNSCIAELRANGYPIECKREGRVWLYKLA